MFIHDYGRNGVKTLDVYRDKDNIYHLQVNISSTATV